MGERKIEVDKFVYDRDGEVKSTGATRWRCSERETCTAAVHVIGDEVVAVIGTHTHEADPFARKAAEMRQCAKDAAKLSKNRQKAVSGTMPARVDFDTKRVKNEVKFAGPPLS